MTLHLRKLQQWEHDRRTWAEAAEVRILRKVRQKPQAACVKRVLQLLQLMKHAETLRLELFKRVGELRDNPATFAKHETEICSDNFTHPSLKELQSLNLDYWGCLKEIERLGKRYRWSPTVRGGGFHGLTRMFTWSKRTEDEAWENLALFWLLNHVESSGLAPSRILRFRQCRHCSEWLCARSSPADAVHLQAELHAPSPSFRRTAVAAQIQATRDYNGTRPLKSSQSNVSAVSLLAGTALIRFLVDARGNRQRKPGAEEAQQVLRDKLVRVKEVVNRVRCCPADIHCGSAARFLTIRPGSPQGVPA